MNRLGFFSFALVALFSAQVNCAASKVEVTVSVDHNAEPLPRFAVTEPAWVTELLGPTEAPITTKRPSLPDRIRNTIQQGIQTVGNRLTEFPNRITQIFQGIQQGATSIIRRPTSSTSKPLSAVNGTTEATSNTTSTAAPPKV